MKKYWFLIMANIILPNIMTQNNPVGQIVKRINQIIDHLLDGGQDARIVQIRDKFIQVISAI